MQLKINDVPSKTIKSEGKEKPILYVIIGVWQSDGTSHVVYASTDSSQADGMLEEQMKSYKRSNGVYSPLYSKLEIIKCNLELFEEYEINVD